MSSAVGASAWTAAIAAWIWNGPGWLRRRQARTSVVSFGDQRAVPPRAVLVGEPDHRTVGGGAGRLAGFGEQHQREQADGLGLVGHELDEHAAEPDRLAREVDAGEGVAGLGGVPFGVDEVDGGEHRVQPVGELGGAGDAVGRVVVAQLPLRPDDPLGERRLGQEEGTRDLGRVETAEQPQRERDLRVGRRGRDGSRGT